MLHYLKAITAVNINCLKVSLKTGCSTCNTSQTMNPSEYNLVWFSSSSQTVNGEKLVLDPDNSNKLNTRSLFTHTCHVV